EIEWRIRPVHGQAGKSPLFASGEDAPGVLRCEVSLRVLQSADAAHSAVYVEAAVAEESDQGHPAAFGRCYRQARRGADSGQQRNACHGGLLYELEAGAPADQ